MTDETKAPERLRLLVDGGGVWASWKPADGEQVFDYVRADLHDALAAQLTQVTAERDDALAALEILKPGITTSEHADTCQTRSATFRFLPCDCENTNGGPDE